MNRPLALLYYEEKRQMVWQSDVFSRKQMTPHAGGYEEAAQRKLGFFFKRGGEWIFLKQ
jgi:hypothetical protein